MHVLAYRPNLLFLVGVRDNALYLKLLITRLRMPIYRPKILKARTKISYCHMDPHDDDIYPGDTTIVYSIENGLPLHCQKFHREDGPARIYSDLDNPELQKEWSWIVNGQLHRDNGPAVIDLRYQTPVDEAGVVFHDCDNNCGPVEPLDPLAADLEYDADYYINCEWYQHGEYHRDGGPAIYNRNFMAWYQHGKLHRDDGFALIYHNPDQDCTEMIMFRNGKKHCETGPALLYVMGMPIVWYGNHLHMPNIEMKVLYEEWRLDDMVHRIDGPAFRHRYTLELPWDEKWVQYGKKHRIDGPAVIEYVENEINVEEWWVAGLRHREDGPAIVNHSRKIKEWWYGGKRHRVDGPAVIRPGLCQWYKQGKKHRTDGPAVVRGKKFTYFIDGEPVEPF